MNSVALLTALGISLGLTLVFEVGFYLIAYKRNKSDVLLVVLVNTLTNPIVVLLYWIAYFNTNWNTIAIIVPLELFAVLTEGFIYSKHAQSIKRPFLFSLAANAFSFTLGFIIMFFLF